MIDRRRFMLSALPAVAGLYSPALAQDQGENHAVSQTAARAASPGPVSFTISAEHVVGHFPHYWERVVGSGHAILALRSDYRDDLQRVHRATGMQAVRFHGILDDDVGVCALDQRGDVTYNFQYLDQIYDTMVDMGVHPFVELSFMPRALASGDKKAFWYQANVTPPKDPDSWPALVAALARHLFDRYGASEISQWMFEVWNEPNLDFWSGTQAQYFDFYRRTALALKSVDERLRVGGPATAQTAWISEFIDYCVKNKAPVDFVSTHIYANDPQDKVFGKPAHYPLEEVIPLALTKVRNQVAESALPRLPVYVTEWNSTYRADDPILQTSFNASFIAHTIKRCHGLAEGMSYWCFSDVFEEQGVPQSIFGGGFGMIGFRRILKPAFHVFELLHKLGNDRLAVGDGPAIATRRGDGSVAVLVWNMTARDAQGAPLAGQPLNLRIALRGLGHRNRMTVTRVDDDHGCALGAYQQMESPRYATLSQLQELRRASELPAGEHMLVNGGARSEVPIVIPPQGVVLLEFQA